MWSRRLSGLTVLVAAALPFFSLQRVDAEGATPNSAAVSPPSANVSATNRSDNSSVDVGSKRKTARRELMLQSLRGIRGLAYGVVHAENPADLEKIMAKRLKQLDIPLHPFSTLKPGVKPVDALLEVKVMSVPTANYVQLGLFQWVSLLRPPKTEVRAITYHDSMLSAPEDLGKTVDELTNQFVIDVLKANEQNQLVAKEKVPAHKKRLVR
jgi:hypothetical protein